MLDRVLAAGIGALTGTAAGLLMLLDSSWVAIGVAIVVALLLALVVRRAVPAAERPAVARILAAAYAVHLCTIAVVHTYTVAQTQAGLVTGDDWAYGNLAWSFVEYLRGTPRPPYVPPMWAGDAYLFGTWVYLESAVFALVGYRIEVPEILNAAFALMAAIVAYDIGRRIFDRRAALVCAALVALWPSLVVWSSLNLKDALAILLAMCVLWTIVRYQSRASLALPLLAFALLVPMESLRRYLFVGLALLVPIGVWAAPLLARRTRLRDTAIACVLAATAVSASSAGIMGGPELLATLEGKRESMAVGAQTAFVQAPIVVNQGDTFVVPTSIPAASPLASSPSASAPPAEARVVHVQPGTRVVVVQPGAAPQPVPVDAVIVRPGDIVVVGRPDATPAPEAARRPLPTDAAVAFVSSETRSGSEELVGRTISHVPIGLAFSFFAPFPWASRRLLDLAIVPEMLAWYVLIVAAIATLWRYRSRWRMLLVPALYAAGILLLLALAEGNVGTLFRHRAMVVPDVIVLASPMLVAWWARIWKAAR